MESALDIYIKLLIAIISFIAPLLIHLLSIFSDGVAVKKRRWDEYESQTNNLLRARMTNHGNNPIDLANKSSQEFEKQKKVKDKQLKYLDPKGQIKFLFPAFFSSLISIILFRMVCDIDIKDFYLWAQTCNYIIRVVLILISIILASWGVHRLYYVALAIIDVKGEIALHNEEEKQQLRGNKITTTDTKS